MHVLQIMAGAAHGGAEGFFERLVVALSRDGLEQGVAVRPHGARLERLRAQGVVADGFGFGGPLDLRTRLGLLRLIRRTRPRIIVSWMNRATVALPPPVLLPKLVRVGRLGGYYDLKYYRRCDHLVGNTQDLVDYMRAHGWPAERAHYLPNFPDARPAAAAIDRASLGTPDGVPLILALGRLHTNKAFDLLLAALVGAPEVHAWIAGEGPERAELEARIAGLELGGRVRLLGWREDVAALLAACDLLVVPSRHEPLGNVVLEGWAQRRAVLATASQGPAQLITDHLTGRLVPVDDAAALARTMSALLADPAARTRLAEAGHAAYLDGYAEPAVVRQWRDFFTKIDSAP